MPNFAQVLQIKTLLACEEAKDLGRISAVHTDRTQYVNFKNTILWTRSEVHIGTSFFSSRPQRPVHCKVATHPHNRLQTYGVQTPYSCCGVAVASCCCHQQRLRRRLGRWQQQRQAAVVAACDKSKGRTTLIPLPNPCWVP